MFTCSAVVIMSDGEKASMESAGCTEDAHTFTPPVSSTPAPSEPASSPAPTAPAGETKIVYHIGSQDVPYLVKVAKDVESVTLGDFKAALNRPLANTKFFFKTIDEDIG